MKILPIIIAAVLFLVTVSICYIIWYAVRGRYAIERRRRQAEALRREAEREDRQQGRWGVDKHSYCYPKINDTMGYEFITVEKIPVELRPDIRERDKEPEETSLSDSWNYAASMGFTNVTTARATAASTDPSATTEEEDTSYPQRDERDPVRHGSINLAAKAEEPRREEDGPDNPQEENDDDTNGSVNPQDIEDLRNMKEWFNKDSDNPDNLPGNEELLAILEANPEVVDKNEPDREEARRIIQDKEDLENDVQAFEKAAMDASDKSLNDTFGTDIMRQLMGDEQDDEGGDAGDELPEDDIPDPNE